MNDLVSKNFSLPDLQEMEMILKYCEIVSKAPAYSSMGGMPGVFALVMTAKELGIGPMTALNGGMYLIPPGIDKDGRPKGSPVIMMAAKTMSMMIWKAGHTIEEIECNDKSVTLKGTRSDNGVSMTVTMTMDKAKQAQLSHDAYGKPKLWSPWFKNSEDMLWKTCVAKLGRRLYTDVIGNAYEPSEFEEKEPKEDKKLLLEKKSIKGKKINQISNVSECDEKHENIIDENSIQNKESLEDFKKNFGIDGENTELIYYIENLSEKRNISFDEMVVICYENKDAFLKSYENYVNSAAKSE